MDASDYVEVREKHCLITQGGYDFAKGKSHDCYTNVFETTLPSTSGSEKHSPSVDDYTLSSYTQYVSLAYPITHPRVAEYISDPVLELFEAKHKQEKDIALVQNIYMEDKKWLNEDFVSNNSAALLPRYFVAAARGQFKDPDPYFDQTQTHNYYFTGGTLCSFARDNGEVYLVSRSKQDNICVMNFENPELYKLLSTSCKNIHAIKVCAKKKSANKVRLAIRGRNKVEILELALDANDGLEMNSEPIWTIENDIPFIDVMSHKNKYIGVLDVKQSLKIVDLSENATILDHCLIEDPIIGLGQCQFIDRNSIFHTYRNAVQIFDIRSLDTIKTILEKPKFLACNELQTFCTSKLDKNYFYLASKHDIIKLDIRLIDKPIKRWSHMLRESPTVIKTFINFENEEFLVTSNFKERVFLRTSMEENFLTMKVPIMEETLRNVRLFKKFDLDQRPGQRFALGISGLDILEAPKAKSKYSPENCGMVILTSNAIGDIFRNDICTKIKEEMQFNTSLNTSHRKKRNKTDYPLILLKHWIESLPILDSKPFNAGDIKDLIALKDVLIDDTPIKSEKEFERSLKVETARNLFLAKLDEIKTLPFAEIWEQQQIGCKSEFGDATTYSDDIVLSSYVPLRKRPKILI